jgi:hypothetical protein
MQTLKRIHGLLALALLSTPLAACAVSEDDEGVIGDESALTGGLSGNVAIGTQLLTTARVNFREEADMSSDVMRVLSKGAKAVVIAAEPDGRFYNVRNGSDEGWVHGAYLARADGAPPAPGGGTTPPPPGGGGTTPPPPSGACKDRRLTFSADFFRPVPAAGAAMVWGGNATGGDDVLYSSDFLSRAQQARARGVPVFAYLEGPCGDTDGVDDGERARCASIHNNFNRANAPGTPNTPAARWKPYTMKQFTESGRLGIDYCEIDNLSNNVTIPLNPLAREIKTLYDAGKIHCRLVLKNVDADDIDSLRAAVAPTPAAANFIAPFQIFEANNTSQKASLDAAMVRLKGPGAKAIISTDTNNYGSAFTNDTFKVCD